MPAATAMAVVGFESAVCSLSLEICPQAALEVEEMSGIRASATLVVVLSVEGRELAWCHVLKIECSSGALEVERPREVQAWEAWMASSRSLVMDGKVVMGTWKASMVTETVVKALEEGRLEEFLEAKETVEEVEVGRMWVSLGSVGGHMAVDQMRGM